MEFSARNDWVRIGVKHHHGIDIPLFSLHSKNSAGIGEYPDLIPLIHWCKEIGFDTLQLLPINDTQYETSPYSAISAFALNPWHLGLVQLPFLSNFPSLKLKAAELNRLCRPQRVQYGEVFKEKEAFFKEYLDATAHLIKSSPGYKEFLEENSDWLNDYDAFKGPTGHLLQFLCHQQMQEVRREADEAGVFLKGDIPILINRSSIDVLTHPDFFLQEYSAGAPPDMFNECGQNWDFPIYNWDRLEKTDYLWWKRRLKIASQYYHIYRLDHIAGFYRIYAIPEGLTAKEGIFIPENEWTWVAHGEKILKMVLASCDMLPIGEDLGHFPDALRHSMKNLGVCGTKVMRWERNRIGCYIDPEDYAPLSLTCVSTHDTDTLQLWWKNSTEEAKAFAKYKGWEYNGHLSKERQSEILYDSHHTGSLFHINLLNEYLFVANNMTWEDPEDERINIPGTVSDQNWTYRFRPTVEEIVSSTELKKIMKSMILMFIFCPLMLFASAKTLYNSLDTRSVAQHLALYELYPETPEGKLALSHAWQLLTGGSKELEGTLPLANLSASIESLISLVNKQPGGDIPLIDEKSLIVIEKVAARLPNRKLKGYAVTTQEETLALPWTEVDLARGLFLTEMQDKQKIRSYEAMIDLMALQILAKLPQGATPREKIKTINAFIFEELGFRFPPQSLLATDVDLYTFLPSVLDSRKGVCLGVSILYLCLAQRLDLTLEAITPPGHIFVRYRNGDEIINIETTARGVNMESEVYLGIETRSLEQRNIKEVIGLAHMNQAAVFWHKEDYEKALESYRTAQKYLIDDMLLKEFMALNYLLAGHKEQGEALLIQVKDHVHDYAITKDSVADDYLNGKVDATGLKSVFMHVDEKRESLLKKKEALLKTIETFPEFRSGLFSLATTWMQLHRKDEALKVLEQLHRLDPSEPTTEYYLSILYAERLDYNRAWAHLQQTERIVEARDHHPKALKELRKELEGLCPH